MPAAATEAISLSPAFYVAMALYAGASLVYFAVFFGSRAWVPRVARWLLLAALVVHGVDIALRDLQSVHPATSVRESLGMLSWVVVAAYLVATWRYGLTVIGAFVAPVALVLLGAARLTPSDGAVSELTALGRVHISLATLGVAIFTFATALAAVYLLEERNLKRKNFEGVLYRRGIALETLDTLVHRLTLIGFPIFTVAMMLGVLWVGQRATGFARPEYLLAAVAWTAFGALLLGRTARGWRGRKAALLTIGGFGAAVMVLLIYFARRAFG